MATPYVPIDLADSSYAGVNITDATFTAIVAATGLEMPHADVGVMRVKNTTGGALTFKITVPQPAESGFALIGKTVTTQDYTIDANDTHDIANMGAYADTTTQLLTVDASATGLEFYATKPVNAFAKS